MKIKNSIREKDYYTIIDHLRTVIFSLADGAKIESKGRGYVLRKLLKRACLSAYFQNFLLHELLLISKKIIEVNNYHAHLKEKENFLIIQLEEEIKKENSFILESAEKIKKYCFKKFQKIINSEEVFLWYDTYGIPLGLINYCLKKEDRSFSETEFNKLLKKQKSLGREDRKKNKILIF